MLLGFTSSARAATEDARVLILNGSDAYLPAFLVIDGAMRARLADEGSRRILLFTETLDAQRFPIATFEAEYLALLDKKYRPQKIEVVVAFSRPALDFFVRHGQRLWPNARLVYQGFIGDKVGLKALPADARGVMAPEDVRGTIDLARRLQPNAGRMLVITGTADLDKRYELLARAALSAGVGQTSVEFLSGLPEAELLAASGRRAPESIVLYTTQFRDRDGRAYVPRDLLREITQGVGGAGLQHLGGDDRGGRRRRRRGIPRRPRPARGRAGGRRPWPSRRRIRIAPSSKARAVAWRMPARCGAGGSTRRTFRTTATSASPSAPSGASTSG